MNTNLADRTQPVRAPAFPCTQWSVVLQAGGQSGSEARAALEVLCRLYWYPLYAFIRRQGRSHHEAEDCTQEFLARLLAHAGVAHARPERGRFRTFLLTSLRNFLTNDWKRTQADKRGGGRPPLSLDLERAEQRYIHEPIDPGLSPEQAFDRTWALDLLERATASLRDDYARSGRGPLFAALVPLLWVNSSAESSATHAARLGLSASAFGVALHRLRRRFGERLRSLVAETVEDPAQVDAELHHLITAVSSDRGPP